MAPVRRNKGQDRKSIEMRFIYFIIFALSINLAFASADTKPVKVVLRIDTSNVNVRKLDEKALNEYRKQPAFQYKETRQQLSWWDRFWRWFWNWVSHLFRFNTGKGYGFLAILWDIVQILLLVGGLAALIFFIFKATGMDMRNIFLRKPTVTPVPYSEFFEDINAIDFDAEIENAVAKHNYRFAVRLLYLKCLKQLSDSGLIDWKIDKTNNSYINELQPTGRAEAFGSLTRQFEYVWYGEFLIDGAVYNNIAHSFSNFNKQTV